MSELETEPCVCGTLPRSPVVGPCEGQPQSLSILCYSQASKVSDFYAKSECLGAMGHGASIPVRAEQLAPEGRLQLPLLSS